MSLRRWRSRAMSDKKKNPILSRIRKLIFFDCRWWKPWTSPMSMSLQEVLASMRRQTLILCVYRMMMETIRPRLSVFTISPERVSIWADLDYENGRLYCIYRVGYLGPLTLSRQVTTNNLIKLTFPSLLELGYSLSSQTQSCKWHLCYWGEHLEILPQNTDRATIGIWR